MYDLTKGDTQFLRRKATTTLAQFGESENEEDTIVTAKKKNDERRSGLKLHKKNGTMHRPEQHHVCFLKRNHTRLGEGQHPRGHASQDAVLFPLVLSGGEIVSCA